MIRASGAAQQRQSPEQDATRRPLSRRMVSVCERLFRCERHTSEASRRQVDRFNPHRLEAFRMESSKVTDAAHEVSVSSEHTRLKIDETMYLFCTST